MAAAQAAGPNLKPQKSTKRLLTKKAPLKDPGGQGGYFTNLPARASKLRREGIVINRRALLIRGGGYMII